MSAPAGPLRGLQFETHQRFAGVPYAAPPVGDLRFRPPQRLDPWSEVLDAANFGPIAPQNASALDRLLGEPESWDEDCLRLNVWTPAADDGARPVMVWIHGGAFSTGSGSSVLYHGESLATIGDVVVVTINYRLNAFGFLDVSSLDPDRAASGNNGILDQLAALDWIQENIASLGGDPSNVTVFGESAGAMSIGSLLAIAGDGSRFQRAILQSGSPAHAIRPEQAAANARVFFDLLGISTIDELLALPAEALLDAEMRIPSGAVLDRCTEARHVFERSMPFQPVVDGVTIPEHPMALIAQGAAATIDVMAGTNTDENRLFSMLERGPLTEERLRQRATNVHSDPSALLEHYRGHAHLVERNAPEPPSPSEMHTHLMTDAVFFVPTMEMFDRLHAPGDRSPLRLCYRFAWPSSVADGLLGACHALEIPFIFDRLTTPGVAGFTGDGAPEGLGEVMRAAWLDFAHGRRPVVPTSDGPQAWPDVNRLQGSTTAAVFGSAAEPDHAVSIDTALDQETLDAWSGTFAW